ncbi:hypothetical protein BH09MYX1_BH09MYX1_27750 [soil metagenome]
MTTTTTENRRWLIGISISVAFGLFGAVMALLSYRAKVDDKPPPAAHTTPVTDPPRIVAPDLARSGNGRRDHGRK